MPIKLSDNLKYFQNIRFHEMNKIIQNRHLIQIIYDYVKKHYHDNYGHLHSLTTENEFDDYLNQKSMKTAYLLNQLICKELPIIAENYAARKINASLFLAVHKSDYRQVNQLWEKEANYLKMSFENEFKSRLLNNELNENKIQFRHFHIKYNHKYETIGALKHNKNSFYLNANELILNHEKPLDYAQFNQMKKAYKNMFMTFHQNDAHFQKSMKNNNINEAYQMVQDDFFINHKIFDLTENEWSLLDSLNDMNTLFISHKLARENNKEFEKLEKLVNRDLSRDLSHLNKMEMDILLKSIQNKINIDEYFYLNTTKLNDKKPKAETTKWLNQFISQFEIIIENDLFSYQDYQQFTETNHIENTLTENDFEIHFPQKIFNENIQKIDPIWNKYHSANKSYQNQLFSLELNDETLFLYDEIKQHLKENCAFLFDLNQHHHQTKVWHGKNFKIKSLKRNDVENHPLYLDFALGKIKIDGEIVDLTQPYLENSHQFKSNVDFLYPYLSNDDIYQNEQMVEDFINSMMRYNSFACAFSSAFNSYGSVNVNNIELDVFDNGIKVYQLVGINKSDFFLKITSSCSTDFGSEKGYSQKAYQAMAELAYENNFILTRNLNDLTKLGRDKLSNKFKKIREHNPNILVLEYFGDGEDYSDKRDYPFSYSQEIANWFRNNEENENVSKKDLNQKIIEHIGLQMETNQHLFIQANFDTIFYREMETLKHELSNKLNNKKYTDIKKTYDSVFQQYEKEMKIKYQQFYQDLQFLHNISYIRNDKIYFKCKNTEEKQQIEQIKMGENNKFTILNNFLNANRNFTFSEKTAILEPLFKDKLDTKWNQEIQKQFNKIKNQQKIKPKI